MSNKVFEEAIADAKKLREVAEENAKKAILEAVTPKIREFIESELLEGSEEEVEETEHNESSEVEEEVTLDEASLKKLSTLLGVNITDEIASDNAKSAISESTREAFDKLDEAQKKELKNIANKINSRKRTLSACNISNKESNLKENSQMKDKYYEVDLKALREAVESELSENLYEEEEAHEDADEDASLEEMLQELKLVLDLGEDIEEDQVPEELRGMLDLEDEEDEDVDLEDEEDEDEGMVDAEEADAEEDDDAEEDAEVDFQALAEMMDAELDEDEMVEVDEEVLAEEILRIRKMVREGKMDHQFGGKGETKAGVDGSFGGKGSGKAGVKKSFGGGAEGQDAFVNPPTMNKLAEAFRSERRKNRALDEKLKKYRSAVNTLREQLEDLNLFNAKLLYVNKLLQNKNLNESEKKSVIKALDEANSLREAKSLYKSLTETFTHGGKKTLAESRNRGSSSRTTTSSASKVGAPELDRWSRLAGLTK